MVKEIVKKEKDVIIEGKKYIKEQFMIEESHPAIGRMLVFEGIKFKIMDEQSFGSERSGTFITRLSERDEEVMEEYDRDLEELSEKLVDKIDIKRLIKESIKEKRHSEIKTGLFILKAKEEGKDVEEEHIRGCYNYKIHYKNQSFDFIGGIPTIAEVVG